MKFIKTPTTYYNMTGVMALAWERVEFSPPQWRISVYGVDTYMNIFYETEEEAKADMEKLEKFITTSSQQVLSLLPLAACIVYIELKKD